MRYQLTILRSLCCYLCVTPIILTLPRRTTRFSARSFTHFSRCCTYMYIRRASIVIRVPREQMQIPQVRNGDAATVVPALAADTEGYVPFVGPNMLGTMAFDEIRERISS